MKSARSVAIFIVQVCMIVVLTTACGKGDDAVQNVGEPKPSQAAETKKADPPQPITLKVFNGLFVEEDWQKAIVEPLKKKFPHITLNQGAGLTNTSKEALDKLVLAGDTPDIVLSGIAQARYLQPLDLILDHSALMKKHNVNLNSINKTVVDYLKLQSSYYNTETVTLPLYINFQTMTYNKDLFDRFALPYPKNHMSYDEVIDLSRKMTRVDGGVQYYGYVPGSVLQLAGQLSLSPVDAKTNKAKLDGYEKIFQVLKQAKDVLGSPTASINFYKDKNLAMFSNWLASTMANAPALKEMKWGMVTMPEFKDRPGIATETDFHTGYVTKTSKYQDAAFQVISEIMLSKEIQTLLTRAGKISLYDDKDIFSQWGQNNQLGSAEVLLALTETKMAPSRPQNPFVTVAAIDAAIDKEFTFYNNGGKDLNTALRSADETINQIIQSELGKK